MFDRRRRVRAAVLVLAVLPANAFALALATTSATAGTQPTTNACFSNATATYSDLSWTLAGEATPDPLPATGNVTLGSSTVGVNIPATLLIAGYNLGLLTKGANSIPTTVYVARTATGVVGGPKTQVDSFSTTVSTTITDPNGTPGTGDETATPLAVNKDLPNMVVTPSGDTVTFAQAAPGTLPLLPAGVAGAGAVQPKGSLFATASVANGVIRANFDCFPGSTVISPPGGTSGTTYTPATPAPFETVTAVGVTTTTGASTTTSSSTSTSTTSSTTTSTTVGTTTTTTPTGGATSSTGTATYVTTCKNSVTPDLSELTFAITGTAPAQITAGSPATLSGQSWTVGVPASVLDTGLRLGLLKIGDVVAGTATPTLFASNTVEGSKVLAPIALKIGPILDDGTASTPPKSKAASVTFAVPDTTWTSVGGTIGYSLGSATMEVAIGALKVKFTCNPKDASLTIARTNVTGSTGVSPGGRPAASPAQVLGVQATNAAQLPRTGSELLWPVGVAVALLDIGYLAESAVRPMRRRLRRH